MAADQFTQIASGLFRDGRLSTGRRGSSGTSVRTTSGWQVTLAGLVRVGPDGRDAVRAGLKSFRSTATWSVSACAAPTAPSARASTASPTTPPSWT
ncbi:hypothetical protein LV779_21815 [Streptomyces thinghirensis]|nr:hypothetical protein [Streptomyces thinghirensis]